MLSRCVEIFQAKAWFDYFQAFLTKELGFSFCSEQPGLGKNGNVVVDDDLFAGPLDYVENVFLSVLKSKFDLNVSMLKRVGDTVSFLKRSYPLEEEGVSIRPGQYGENMVKAYEEKKGRLKSQQLPRDSTFHMEDSSPDILLYRSLVGMGIYLSQERPDLSFGIKELAGKMSRPTQLSMQRMKKFLGYVKGTIHYTNYVK